MCRGVDLDQVDRAVGSADKPEPLVPDDQSAHVVVELLQVGVDLALLLSFGETDPEPGWANLRNSDPV